MKFVLLFTTWHLWYVVHDRYILSTSGYTKYGFSGFQSYRSTYVKLQIGKYHFLEIWESCWKLEKTGETNRIQKWMSCNYDDDVQSLNDVSNSKTNVFFQTLNFVLLFPLKRLLHFKNCLFLMHFYFHYIQTIKLVFFSCSKLNFILSYEKHYLKEMFSWVSEIV